MHRILLVDDDVSLADMIREFLEIEGVRGDLEHAVIMLTARGDDVDRIVWLEIGADDYVPKPVNPRELVARIRAVLRRAAPDAPTRAATSGSEKSA